MKAERLYDEVRPHAVPNDGGRLLLRAGDALALVSDAADEGVPVLGVAGLRVAGGAAEAAPAHQADFRARVAEGHGCWAEAEAFLRERAAAGLAFEVALGDDPLEVV